MLGDDAPHELSPSEHDVTGRLHYVGGGKLEDQEIASRAAVETNGSGNGSGYASKAFFGRGRCLASIKGHGQDKSEDHLKFGIPAPWHACQAKA